MPGLPPPRPLRQQRPVRRRHRYTPPPRPKLRWRRNAAVAGCGLLVLLVIWAMIARAFARSSNTSLNHFDAILVLGSPADSDGNPRPEQLASVLEGVREYTRGVAPRLILSGGAAHNHYIEADVMARAAEAEGIPESAIFLDSRSTDTIENFCYSEKIMQAHGWHSVEVIASATHLPRAAIIAAHTDLQWRIHVAPPLAPRSTLYSAFATALETLKTMRYLVYAQWGERCPQ